MKQQMLLSSTPEIPNVPAALKDLRSKLDDILRRDVQNELVRLIIEMHEASHIELCMQEVPGTAPVVCWKATEKRAYWERAVGMVNRVSRRLARFFLRGVTVFTVEGTPSTIRWIRFVGSEEQTTGAGVADVRKSTDWIDLGIALCESLKADGEEGEDELARVMLEVYEAGRLEMLVDASGTAPIRYWRYSEDLPYDEPFEGSPYEEGPYEEASYFDHARAIVDDYQGRLALLFLYRDSAFTVDEPSAVFFLKPICEIRWGNQRKSQAG